MRRPLIELPRLSLKFPSPGLVSPLVSHVNRKYPLEPGKDSVSKLPRPDHDPTCCQITAGWDGLADGAEQPTTRGIRKKGRAMREGRGNFSLFPPKRQRRRL